MNWLKYLGLAVAIAGAVPMVQALVSMPGPVTGDQIDTAVLPAISAVNAVFPQAKIPAALVMDCANAVATAINQYKGKAALPSA